MPAPILASIDKLHGAGIFHDVASGHFGHKFRRYNVIYGFNGCGKTTLTRIFESISRLGQSPNLPENIEFAFQTSDSVRLTGHAPSHSVCKAVHVFNEDFISRSLSWKDGTASPIMFLGEQQTDLASKLKIAEADNVILSNQYNEASKHWARTKKQLDTFCTSSAKLISSEANLGRSYLSPKLKNDIELHNNKDLRLGEAKRTALRQTIFYVGAPEKIETVEWTISLTKIILAVESVLSTTVQDITIESMNRRPDAIPWIEAGVALHKNEQNCLFCEASLSGRRMADLQEAIGGAFAALNQRIESGQEFLNNAVDRIDRYIEVLSQQFDTFPELKAELKNASADMIAALGVAKEAINSLSAALDAKSGLSSVQTSVVIVDDWRVWDAQFLSRSELYKSFIVAHNLAVGEFAGERQRATSQLIDHYLTDYSAEYAALKAECDTAKHRFDKLEQRFRLSDDEIKILRRDLRSHGPAASKLNDLLKSYLGHSEITIAAEEEGYRIHRASLPSDKPLSEGEKTAVAFCYFLISLTADGNKVSDSVIVVDDPISSLDSRCMLFVSALIKRRLANSKQLFILTHNLDFMREMKKWLGSKRKGKVDPANNAIVEDPQAGFFFIETKITPSGRKSKIVELPRLIRVYESEYHFLYDVIRRVAADDNIAIEYAYLVPNAIRKVLETYLAFKSPGYSDLQGLDPIIKQFPALDADRISAVILLVQSESHAQNVDDALNLSVYTVENVMSAAVALRELIQVSDRAHFDRMEIICARAHD